MLISTVLPGSSTAQVTAIVPDTSLPTNSVILPNGNVFDITAGTSVGNNLFHSFQEFNVGAGDTANFIDPGGVANILSRVTGTNVSNIFGQLRSDSSANFFFLNPNGVIFGPNATLDVGGSFHVSTADVLRLGSGEGAGMFSARDSTMDVLTSAPPSAFGFLGGNPGAIQINQGELSVKDNNSLLIVGGDISITGDGGR